MKEIIPMKTIRMVKDIFQQGDARYEDFDNALMVATFLEEGAIKIEKKMVSDIEVTDEEMRGVTRPQEEYKIVARRLFEKKGYKFRGYEVSLNGGRVDVLAKHPVTGETLAIECCACRFTKTFDYLELDNVTFWILSQADESPVKQLPLYIIKRGPKWNEYIKRYKSYIQNQIREELQRVGGSPLEWLYENESW